ncbi:hypothetical protein PGC34_18285 [Pseudomonas kribbensis]|uniref:hypothetical protein n=1 Tax=Pseudomonas kribbensis TaxID=1628086 RepID=UPI003BF8C15C
MIIIVRNFFDLDIDSGRKLRAIENLLCAHGEGRHVLWMPIELVSALQSVECLSSYSQRVLVELKSSVLETRKIEDFFDFYLEVDFSRKLPSGYSEGRICVSYVVVSTSSFLQKTVFLTENLLDGEAFSKGAEVFVFKNKMISAVCRVDFDFYNGGGSTTFDVFRVLKEQGKLFCCIVDSDKEHPKASLGSTAKRFNRVGVGYGESYYFEILDCHEIENILPKDLLLKVAEENWTGGAIFAREELLSFRQYADHKSGLTLAAGRALDFKHFDTYWDGFYDGDEDEWLCEPLGAEILEKCVEKMNQLSIRDLSEMINFEIDQGWLRLSRLVASWGVGMKRSIN